jgi:predicted Ser/Thr protein kinase
MIALFLFSTASFFVPYSATDCSKLGIRTYMEDFEPAARILVGFVVPDVDLNEESKQIAAFTQSAIPFSGEVDFMLIHRLAHAKFVGTLPVDPPAVLLFSGPDVVASSPFPLEAEDRMGQMAEWIDPEWQPLDSMEQLPPRLGNLPLALLIRNDADSAARPPIANLTSVLRPFSILRGTFHLFKDLGFENETLLLFRRADRSIVPVANSIPAIVNASLTSFSRFDSDPFYDQRLAAIYFDESWNDTESDPLYSLGEEFREIQFRVLERSEFDVITPFRFLLDVLPTFIITSLSEGWYYSFDALRGVDISDPSWLAHAREYIVSALNGSLPKCFLTEAVNSSMNRGPIVRLSSATYHDFVNDESVDVLVMFHRDNQSANVDTKAFEAAAAVVLENGVGMKFGVINHRFNSFDPGLRMPFWKSFPQIVLFPKANKSDFVSFFGPISKNLLLRFLKGNSADVLAIDIPRVTQEELQDDSQVLAVATPPPFLPVQLGDGNRQWKIEKALVNATSRYGHFFLVAEKGSLYILKATRLASEGVEKNFEREVDVLSQLAGLPYFPRILHCFQDKGPWSYPVGCIVMTYAARGSLSALLQENLTQENRRNLTLGMARALAAFHAKGFVHDDVKPANFVLTEDGVVQLIDFQSTWPEADPSQQSRWGTVGVESPERVARQPRGFPADAWALGAAIWSFWEETTHLSFLLHLVNVGERIPFSCATPRDIRAVVCRLLTREPENRLTAQGAVEALSNAAGRC